MNNKQLKSQIEVNRDFWKTNYESLRNLAFIKKLGQVESDMKSKYSKAIFIDWGEDLETDFYLTKFFEEFLSIVYKDVYNNRFLSLELRDMGLKHNTLVLSIDADSALIVGRDIQFALFVFIEEWYPELNYSNILLEWG